MSDIKDEKPAKLARRQFLRGSGALAVGLASGSAMAGEAEPTRNRIPGDHDYDAVVIGGGFAGVTAARELRQDGFSTVILEARNRLGGRTFYSEFAGMKVDMGGTWIHWSQPFVWAEKERYDLNVVETPGAAAPDHVYLRIGDETRELGLEDIYSVIGAFDAYVADGRQILERPYDIKYQLENALEADKISAKDRLDQLDLTEVQRVAMDGIIGSTAHNSSEHMSYLESLRWFGIPGFSYMPFMDAVARYKFEDGTKSLIDKMIEDGKPDVRLSTPVQSIEDTGDGVRITTARGDVVTAAVAVIALPMNTIADVEFKPPLAPEVVEAANERHTGTGYKVHIKVKGKVGKFMALGVSTDPLSILITNKEFDDYTLLTGFGASSDALDVYDTAALQAEVRKFIPDAVVESAFSYDWVLDPYSKGTYCSYKPGWLAKYYDHFQQDNGRIVYAQGDHGEGWRGFIDGAIGAGMKAAERIRARWA